MSRRILLIVFVIAAAVNLWGCGWLSEAPKVVWGSSTKALEEARAEAVQGTFLCSSNECFNEVLNIAGEEEYVLFIVNKLRHHIVLMGIPGSVGTTEVGVFFEPQNDKETRIDISSLSSNAKRNLSNALFSKLEEKFVKLK